MEKPLDFDPATGLYTFREVQGDKVHYRHAPDTEYTAELLKFNRDKRDDESTLPRRSAPTFQHAARIPTTLWLLWESLGITRDPNELLKAIERNSEYKTSKKKLC